MIAAVAGLVVVCALVGFGLFVCGLWELARSTKSISAVSMQNQDGGASRLESLTIRWMWRA